MSNDKRKPPAEHEADKKTPERYDDLPLGTPVPQTSEDDDELPPHADNRI
jgi:hypothetical protein